jgi:hypothetical protein
MKIDDKLEIRVVVATLDQNDCIVEIFSDWRDAKGSTYRHQFGFAIFDINTGEIADHMDFADFYTTISDAMNDYNRIRLIEDILEQSKKGKTNIEISEIFDLPDYRVEKILSEYIG